MQDLVQLMADSLFKTVGMMGQSLQIGRSGFFDRAIWLNGGIQSLCNSPQFTPRPENVGNRSQGRRMQCMPDEIAPELVPQHENGTMVPELVRLQDGSFACPAKRITYIGKRQRRHRIGPLL